MGHRLSKIYTKTGDGGTTGLGDNTRIEKDHPRMEAIGDVDELNCSIGVLLSEEMEDEIQQFLIEIQHRLFDLGGELSIPGFTLVTEDIILSLEGEIDKLNEMLPPLKEFILPRGDKKTSYSHFCRAVCRRAERKLITLGRDDPNLNTFSLKMLNRLSDYFFVLSRFFNSKSPKEEIMWKRN
tara:strand:+ start:1360 stop:1905 length:546 start_codon:yes stop_codon:yes gene_type:complete